MLKIESMQQFQQYLAAVEGRIDHHAGRVKHTTLILAGIVAARAVPGTVQVRTYAGATKNVIWFQAAGGEFCLAYNHDEECVDVIGRLLDGETVSHDGLVTVHEAKLWEIADPRPKLIAPFPHKAIRPGPVRRPAASVRSAVRLRASRAA